MNDAPEGRAIRVTYATHASPQSATLLHHVTELMRQQFPLRNVHWRPSPATRSLRPPATRASGAVSLSPHAIRTVQMLPVDLVPIQAAVNLSAPVLARTPCAHLFFVACDDNDVYRTKVRNEVRNWIASLPAHMPQDFSGMRVPSEEGRDVPGTIEPDYLIVLVPPMSETAPVSPTVGAGLHPAMAHTSASKNPMGRFYNMNKGTVLEKLKADFNSSMHERVVYLPKLPGTVSPAASNDPVLWIELMARLKECVANTLGRLVELQDRSITQYDARHTQPDWSFCGSLARTERLIETLSSVELLEDSLALYTELNQRLAQALAAGTATFACIGGTDPGDDSLLLLGPLRKPYQQLLERGTISLFDLRCYLFAQTAMLLGTLGHVVKVMQATPAFVASIARMYMRYGTAHLPRFFVEAWSFSVSLDAVEQCQAWLVEQTSEGDEDPTQLPAFHAAKAALLELAIRQLLRVGICVGHLPEAEPFVLALSGPVDYTAASDAPITRKELAEAMAHRDVFDSQLRNLIHRTVLAASLSQQRHRLFRLKFLLGCLEMLRGTYEVASALFYEILGMERLATWGPLHAAVYAQLLACMRHQQQDQTPAWLDAHVAALQAVCATRALPCAPQPLDEQAVLATLCASSEALATDATLVGYNGLYVHLTELRAQRAADDDGAWLAVAIVSHLPFALHDAHVGVCVANYQQDQLWFHSAPLTLEPGVTHACVYCPMPATGFYHLQATQTRLGARVLLEQLVQGALALATLADAQQHEYARPRVFLPADGEAADVQVVPEQDVRLDRPREVLLAVHAGRNVLDATLHVEVSDGARLDVHAPCAMHCDATPTPQLEYGNNVWRLTGVPRNAVCRLSLPLADVPRSGRFVVHVTMHYRTAQRHADVERVRVRRMPVDLTLPFGIHIQDYFRLPCLLSKLTLEASDTCMARTATPRVVAPPAAELAVAPVPPHTAVLTPGHASGVVLQFTLPTGVQRTRHAAPFRLEVAYRCLRDEVQAQALFQLARLRPPAALAGGDLRLFHHALTHFVRNTVTLEQYAWTNALELGAFPERYWQLQARRWGWPRNGAKTHAMLAMARAVHAQLAEPVPVDATGAPTCGADKPSPVLHDAHAAQRHAWEAGCACLSWRTLSLPLDVPLVDAVVAVTVSAPTSRAVVGQPMEVVLKLAVTLQWGAPAEGRTAPSPTPVAKLPDSLDPMDPFTLPAKQPDADADAHTDAHADAAVHPPGATPSATPGMPTVCLQYNIAADYVHWVVWGDKKGTLLVPRSAATSVHTVQATLVPVHAGTLLLPRVRVAPVPEEARLFRCESYMTNGAASIDTVDPQAPDTYWVDLRATDRLAV